MNVYRARSCLLPCRVHSCKLDKMGLIAFLKCFFSPSGYQYSKSFPLSFEYSWLLEAAVFWVWLLSCVIESKRTKEWNTVFCDLSQASTLCGSIDFFGKLHWNKTNVNNYDPHKPWFTCFISAVGSGRKWRLETQTSHINLPTTVT